MRDAVDSFKPALSTQKFDWRAKLVEYIAGFKTYIPGKKKRSFSKYTPLNYKSWLNQWVDWMEERQI